MRKSANVSLLLTTMLVAFTQAITPANALLFRDTSKSELPLEINISMRYKTEVYGEPFGDFLVDEEDGWMENKQGQKGEYAYLGYNYDDEKITNDRYFSKLGRRGNVFDLNYTGIEWQDVSGALLSWENIIINPPSFFFSFQPGNVDIY